MYNYNGTLDNKKLQNEWFKGAPCASMISQLPPKSECTIQEGDEWVKSDKEKV